MTYEVPCGLAGAVIRLWMAWSTSATSWADRDSGTSKRLEDRVCAYPEPVGRPSRRPTSLIEVNRLDRQHRVESEPTKGGAGPATTRGRRHPVDAKTRPQAPSWSCRLVPSHERFDLTGLRRL